MFERKFFFHEDVSNKQWDIVALDIHREKSELVCIKFSNVKTASFQEKGDVKQMFSKQMYYLKQGHEAINAVLKVCNESGEEYLLLIQMSLSKYEEHGAKHVSINNRYKPYKKTIIDYYRDLCKVEETNCVYLYISPHDCYHDKKSFDVFSDPSMSGESVRNYLVGLLKHDSDISTFVTELQHTLN